MQGFRPQRLVSEGSTSSSNEIEVVEPFCNKEYASTSGYKRNNGLESRSSQNTKPLLGKQKTSHEGNKRWSRDSFESQMHPKQCKNITKNGKENLTNLYSDKADNERQNVQQKHNTCLAKTDCSELTFADETDDDTGDLGTFVPHNEEKCLSSRSTCQDANKEKEYHENQPQQCTRARIPNHHQGPDIQEVGCNTGRDQTKCDCHMNNSEDGASENDTCQANLYTKGANSKTNGDESSKVLKHRDGIINEYQLLEQICHKAIKRKLDEDYREIQKLRKNYISLKKLFLALATLNIILILCVVSVMPVILVTFKLSGGGTVPSDEDIEEISAMHLSSKEAEKVVKKHVLCVDCNVVKEHWSFIFSREGEKDCCLEDVASLVQGMVRYIEKKSKLMGSVINNIKYHTDRLANLETAVFNKTFEAPGGVIPGRQNENISRLINTLLTRKRSAVHLSGTIRHHAIEWTQGYPKTTGKLLLHDNTIQVATGGVYFLYSCIRFDIGQCDRKESVGYRIAIKHGSVLASIHHPCTDGINSETDLIIQKLIHVPVDRRQVSLHVEIDFSPSLVSKDHHHYYGLFEI